MVNLHGEAFESAKIFHVGIQLLTLWFQISVKGMFIFAILFSRSFIRLELLKLNFVVFSMLGY